ncbi:MAG: MBL fold metallo-hydrolase [Candidatus Aureabacteria bacterium]|nr:MBL fold metallo-hydrolase [Candidatus Auribacterota bacterium]
MRMCVLGSGSSGNSIYIAGDGYSFLIDAGLSRRELEGRLSAAGAALSEIEAVLISHEHHDHIRGLAGLCRSHSVPVYVNRQTASAIIEKGIPSERLKFFKNGTEFALGTVTVHPFPVPHDASDPVGFIIRDGEIRIGIVTDCGHPSKTVKRMLQGCSVLVVETNHDQDLLNNGPRHVSLKERIRSDVGHLSNDAAAELIAEVASEELSDVFLAHLSEECNRPGMARMVVERAMREAGFERVNIRLTYADRVSDVVEYHRTEREAPSPCHGG